MRHAAVALLAAALPLGAQPRVPAPPTIVAVQVNIDRGGRFWNRDDREVSWRTAISFARMMAREVPRAEVVGMQEVPDAEAAGKLRELISAETGSDWEYLWSSQGVKEAGDGLAVLWRGDRLLLERDLGRTPIDILDDGAVLRAMGVLLRQQETGRTFGFFTARLAPSTESRFASPVSTHVQREEAARIRDWIDEVMQPHPDDARILAIDLNAAYGTRPWFELHRDFESTGDKRFTHPSHDRLFQGKRYDYLWWDGNGGPRKPGGIVGRAGRSEHFGGKRRFIWAELKL